jgi:4-amino-4-deoxy-L-arabinose transferase-like glycosyltransferase
VQLLTLKRRIWPDQKNYSLPVLAILVLLITLLGSALRLYRLDGQSLWYDEGFSVYLARMDLGEITARTAADIQPPLYYYLLHGWMRIFGDSERALRGLSVLFGVLTVPLMGAMGWRLFQSRLACLLAALLVAVSPLHVWYGQETRMYALLVFLCLLASYLLLRVREAPTRRQRMLLWAAYALTSSAALYTHYFAFFVLAFQVVYLLIVWLAEGRQAAGLMWGGLVSMAIAGLSFLPWLGHLLTRLGADVSYWPGQLKLHEVIVDIAISWVGGESVSEQTGVLFAAVLGLILLLCFIALLSWAAGRREASAESQLVASIDSSQSLLFLITYLLVPPVLIIALSYNSPKFNARYAMVSHPAFLLLLAGGLAALWQQSGRGLSRALGRILSVLALSAFFAVSVLANYQAYADPAFARAGFREVADYLRVHRDPEEAVLLVSGHAFPVFDYYAPGTERYLLPDSPTLDTTRTLDYSSAESLNTWLADKTGLWLVLWQDEVVDPVGYLTTMLEAAAERVPVEAAFPKVELRHYRLPDDLLLPGEPAIAHPADYNYGNRLRLLGYSQTGERQVTMFWEALQPLDEDYRVSVILRDIAGQSWGRWDGRPAAYLYPTDRWREGQIVFGHYHLLPMPGTAPGDYGLDVGVYTEKEPEGLDLLDEAGAPVGKRAVLGAVRLSVPAVTLDEVQISHPTEIDLGDGLLLGGWDLDREQAQPGDRLLLTLVWAVGGQPQSAARVRVLATDAEGQRLDAGSFPLTNVWHPTSIWLPGQAWRGQATFRLPIEAGPGPARVAIQLEDDKGQILGPAVDLGSIDVVVTNRVFTSPQPAALRQANFGDRILLVGADLDPQPVGPGQVLRVILYWQALADMDVPYTAFVHLLSPEGQVLIGDDGEPVGGMRPTIGWVPGEFITDPHDLAIPPEMPPGEYVVEVGLYDAGAPGLPRLPIITNEGQSSTDRVVFGVRVQ